METVISLTREERAKFVSYLEQEAKTAEGMIKVMKQSKVPDFIIKRFLSEMAAYAIVASILKSVEEMEIRK